MTSEVGFAQQGGWSPQPFVPATSNTQLGDREQIPSNRLRPNPSQSINRSASIGQSLPPALSQPPISNQGSDPQSQGRATKEASSKIVLRWQKPNVSQPVANSESYDRAFSTDNRSQRTLIHDPSVQLASHHQNVPQERKGPTSGWHPRSDSELADEPKVAPKRSLLAPSERRSELPSNVSNARPVQYQIPSALDHPSDQISFPSQPPIEPAAEDDSTPPSLRQSQKDSGTIPNPKKDPKEDEGSPFPPRQRGMDGLPDSPSDLTEPPPFEEDQEFDIPPAPPKRPSRTSTNCETVREYALSSDISTIRIDSSPAFVEGYRNTTKAGPSNRDNFIQSSPIRTWYNLDGEFIVDARMVDLRNGQVELERADGTRTTFLMRKLSDADQAYVSDKWGIPITCSLGNLPFEGRSFVDSTVTWKASGACHKPLYFEEMQLERYGHEWGPIAQPVISSAHFFGNVAVLPYKMGIHPMNECQYSLGYYRPGSCAPWTVGPIPISLRGALYQAKAIGGAALLLP